MVEEKCFCGERKTENTEKNPRCKARINNKLNLHTGSGGPESNPGHIVGRQALSPLLPPLVPNLKD